MKWKWSEKAIEIVIARIELLQQRLAALEFALQPIKEHYKYFAKAEIEASAIREALYKLREDAISDLFMFGMLGNAKAQREGLKIAARMYVDEHTSIMQFLEISGLPPSTYKTADQNAFRKEVTTLIKRAQEKIDD